MVKNIAKKVSIIALLTIAILTIISFNNHCFALKDVTDTYWQTWTPSVQDDSALKERADVIVGAIRVIGIVVSVATLSAIGIKFMLGSVEEKANYKQTMLPWLIGAVMVFAITFIPTTIYEFTGESLEEGTYADYVKGLDKGMIDIAYNNSEKYKKDGTTLLYDDTSFVEYLDSELNKISATNQYQKGIKAGIDYAVRTVRERYTNSFRICAEGWKDAVSYIENGTVTSENISRQISDWEEAIENIQDDPDATDSEIRTLEMYFNTMIYRAKKQILVYQEEEQR